MFPELAELLNHIVGALHALTHDDTDEARKEVVAARTAMAKIPGVAE